MTRCWPSSGRARRTEGTTPSHGGRGPVAEPDRGDAIGAHPLGASSDVIVSDGRELGFQRHPPRAAMVGCHDVGPPGAVGAADFHLGMGARVPGCVRQLQLQQVVGERFEGERAVGGARGVGEEPQAVAGGLGVHRVVALVAGQRRKGPDLPHRLPGLPAAEVRQVREDGAPLRVHGPERHRCPLAGARDGVRVQHRNVLTLCLRVSAPAAGPGRAASQPRSAGCRSRRSPFRASPAPVPR